jgi:hypothetical protein
MGRAHAPGVARAPLLFADRAKLPCNGRSDFLAYHSGELALDNDASVKMRVTFCGMASIAARFRVEQLELFGSPFDAAR